MDGLEEEISAIRAEIQKLTNRRRVISASLLSSNAVQSALRPRNALGVNSDASPVVLNSGKHGQSNHHRAVFSATSFPFKDPSPHTESPALLGIRIDICARDGHYVEPYYVILKRVGEEKKLLRIHRHTIPVFFPLKQLEAKHLSIPNVADTSDGSLKPKKSRKQDLGMFVRDLRRELVAWHMRRNAVAWIQEELAVGDSAEAHDLDSELNNAGSRVRPKSRIVAVSPTSIETRYARIEWEDGRVGRIKLSNRGHVERAIVICDEGRDKVMENVLTGGDRSVEGVVERLLTAGE